MHIAQGFCFHFINGGREARREILWLSNTILLSPAHQAEAWEEQTSGLLVQDLPMCFLPRAVDGNVRREASIQTT